MSSTPLPRVGPQCLVLICLALIFCVLLWGDGWPTRAAGVRAAFSYFAANLPAIDASPIAPAGNTITVNSTSELANSTDGLCTLREAITAANSNAPAGAVPGECAAGDSGGSDTIDLSGVSGTISLTTALPDITSSMSINGPGAGSLTVQRSAASGTPEFRVFNVNLPSPGAATFSGLTISNGNASDSNGGGIQNQGTGSVIVTDSSLTNNSSSPNTRGGGGAIFNASSGTISVTNSTLGNNTTNELIGGGGGIANNASGTINATNVTFTNNNATVTNTGNGGGGGAIYNGGAGIVNLSGCTLDKNRINGISGSFSFPSGAAIYNTLGTVHIVNSAISNNFANSGLNNIGFGGIANSAGGIVNLTNSTVTQNSAQSGGGIYNDGGTVNLTNVTVSNNSAPHPTSTGAGIDNRAGAVNIRNSIIALNIAAGGNPDLKGSFTSQGHNLIGISDGSTGFTPGTSNANGDLVGTTASPINPLLGSLSNNGGATTTFALLAGSPALDAGDNCVTQAAHCGDSNIPALTTDQRGVGFNRSVDGADADTTSTVDIGAFEAQVSLENIPDTTVNEDVQVQFTFNVGGAVTGITATSSNPVLVPNNTANLAVSGSGSSRTLTINPTADQSGATTITVSVNGANSQTMSDSFALTVNSSNDAPSFTRGPDQTVNNNAGLQTVNNWATNISPGPSNESNQTLTFIVTANTNPGLFATAPAISSSGTLIYQPAPAAGGTAMISVVLKDDGGTANGGVDTSTVQTFNITVVPLGGFISFSTDTYNTTESSGFVTTTVKRIGDLSRVVTVDYATSADNGLPCSTANGVATSKCDFTAALGTLSFAAGETSKTFTVLISQDSFVEGAETFKLTLSNPTTGAALAAPSTASVNIADDVTEPSTNLIDDIRNFVRQHYHDFLNREPDASGWDFWTNQITSCGSDV